MDANLELRAIVFDMDGVLVDSQRHWSRVQNFFLDEILGSWTAEDQVKIIGLSMPDVYELLVRDYGLQKSYQELVSYYESLAEQIYCEESSLLPGVRELLETLNEEGLPMAVASSSPRSWVEMAVGHFSLSSSFKLCLGSEDVNSKAKPAPDIYQLACKRLGFKPEECLAFEDSDKGIASAKAAGMVCLGIRNGFNEEQGLKNADLVFNSFQELTLEKVKKIFSGTCQA